jgi:hypothetical protein
MRSGLVYVVIVFIIGCLAATTHCKQIDAYCHYLLTIGSMSIISYIHIASDRETSDPIGRPEAQRTYYRDGHTSTSATAVNSTTAAADESKLILQFCVNKRCSSVPEGHEPPYCYCCETMYSEPCFATQEECRAVCPICVDHNACEPPRLPSQEIKA